MKKKNKVLKFFFKRKQIDLFSYIIQKQKVNQKRNQRLMLRFIFFFLSNKNGLQLIKRRDGNKNYRKKMLIYEKERQLLKSVQKVKNYLYLFESTNIISAYSNFFFKSFFKDLINKYFYFNLLTLKKKSVSMKKKEDFLKKILNLKKSIFKDKSNFRSFSPESLIKKSGSRFSSFIWQNSYISFYRHNKKRPNPRVQKEVKYKIWWQVWLLQKFFSAYYGFFCVKKFNRFKIRNKFKKKNSLERVLFLEKTLLMTLVRLQLFHSLNHIKNLVSLGGVEVNGVVVKNLYFQVKNEDLLTFKNSLKPTILKMYLFRLRNSQVLSLFPPYFEYNLKTLTFTRWRDPFKVELQINFNNGAKNPLVWL